MRPQVARRCARERSERGVLFDSDVDGQVFYECFEPCVSSGGEVGVAAFCSGWSMHFTVHVVSGTGPEGRGSACGAVETQLLGGEYLGSEHVAVDAEACAVPVAAWFEFVAGACEMVLIFVPGRIFGFADRFAFSADERVGFAREGFHERCCVVVAVAGEDEPAVPSLNHAVLRPRMLCKDVGAEDGAGLDVVGHTDGDAADTADSGS